MRAGGGSGRAAGSGAVTRRWPLHVSPWVHYATLLAIPLVLALARRQAKLRERFVDPYIWDPIVHDLGFNPVNTALFAVVLLLGVLWWYRLLHHYPIALDWPTIWSGLLVFFWGIVLRVFHDAHLIAPFDPDTACIPGRGLLMGCAGVFFVTPILWFIVGSLLFPFGRLGLAAQRVAARRGTTAGVAVVAVGPAAIAAVTLLLLRSPWTRAAPGTAWVVAAAGAGVACYAWRAHHVGVRWSEAMLMQVLVLVAIVLQPLARLAADAPHPASLAAVPLAAFLAILVAWQARRVHRQGGARGAGPGAGNASASGKAPAVAGRDHGPMGRSPQVRPAAPEGRAGGHVVAFGYLVLLQAGAVAAALVAASQGHGGAAAAWILAAAAGALLVAAVRWRGHGAFAAWATVPGAYIVGGHVLDALATGLGLDVFGAAEKHVLPRALEAALRPLLDGTPLAPYPGFTAMLLYKVPVALFAAWALHVHGRRVLPADLLLMLQMVVATVGAAPGFRNALRQALGV